MRNIFILFFSFLLVGCCTVHMNYPQLGDPQLPVRSFVKISFENTDMRSSGSGVIVRESVFGAFVLTAEHVCDSELPHKYVTDLNMEKYEFEILKVDKKADLCLLFAEGLDGRAVNIANSRPNIASTVYTISAPHGLMDKDYVPISQGLYNGTKDGWEMFSMPITFGSSGGAILNSRGELISINSQVLRWNLGLSYDPYDQITLGSNYDALRKFLRIQDDWRLF